MGMNIMGIGVVGGFGCGIESLADCLNSGSLPKTCNQTASDSDYFYPSYIADTSCLTEFVSKRELRRIDHFSQLALTGAFLSLKDAGIDKLESKETGLIICSGYGSSRTTFSFLDSLIDYGDQCASPTLFSNSVHNSAAGNISIFLNLSGPSLTVSQFELSVHSALISASIWLNEGRVDQILFGAVDETCDVLKYCYNGFFGKRGDISLTPLSPLYQSAIPGEGAVFLLLSKDKPSTKNYGYIDLVQTGSTHEIRKYIPADSYYIVNADGHMECDSLYAEIIPEGSAISCFTPVYGSMPTGPAFDLATAAICFSKGRIFPSTDAVKDASYFQVNKNGNPVNKKNISCIKAGRHGESGIINISNHLKI